MLYIYVAVILIEAKEGSNFLTGYYVAWQLKQYVIVRMGHLFIAV
jgi:hypothetical protein